MMYNRFVGRGGLSIHNEMIAINTKGFVYNLKDIPALYEEHGYDVGQYIRGDFLVCIYDIARNITITISDFGGTHCASVAPPNSTIVTQNSNLIHYQPTIDHRLYIRAKREATNLKDNYHDLFNAIDDAVRIRIPQDQTPLITLSSGHDSGVIACSLRDTVYDTFSIPLHENMDVLNKRLELVSGTSRIITDYEPSPAEFDKYNFRGAFINSAAHYLAASENPNRVILTGLGADEMASGGHRIQYEVLRTFLYDTTDIYDEFNIDLRYPLLDPNVYQEINLLSKPLCRRYKQHFERYMVKHRYPYSSTKASFTL